MNEYEDIPTIFIESSEILGLLLKSYEHLPTVINDFLDKVKNAVHLLKTKPDDEITELPLDIQKFKDDIVIKEEPTPIDKSSIKATRLKLKKLDSDTNDILKKLADYKKSIVFGGSIKKIIIKPKIYSRDVDDNRYRTVNTNIRIVNRALDWVEKVVTDLFNLIDQDLNILTIVESIYFRTKIFENVDDIPEHLKVYPFNDIDNFLFEEIDLNQSDDAPPDVTDEPNELIDDSSETNDDESVDEPPIEEVPESYPKQVDREEESKNGIKRKELYIAFIEYAKSIRSKNTFGSVFDKDAFKVTYPGVPYELRYFYRLANPLLCVLTDNLTFFHLAELTKVNSNNVNKAKLFIFAGIVSEDSSQSMAIVINTADKGIYRCTDSELKEAKPTTKLADSFDLYLEKLIGQKIL